MVSELQEHVAKLLAHADMGSSVTPPLTTDEVLALAASLEYDASPARIQDLIAAGRCTPDAAGRWNEAAIFALVGELEGLRLWRYPSKLHDFKRSQFDLEACRLRAEGRHDELAEAVASQTLRGLLVMLTTCENRMGREALLALVLAKLELLEINL